jgi:hypothetical protein
VILKPGKRLRSAVCATEIVVVRAPSTDIDLRCGGQPMTETADATSAGAPAAGLDGGTLLGKRYVSAGLADLEVLVVKSGEGALSIGDAPMETKDAKPLPSSD